jgi:5-methylcytosine-specific restriction endonuclease McrA
VARVPWQRAITLLFLGKVEVVEEYADREIRAVTFVVKMPSIVRLLRALRRGKKGIKFSRENVYARDHGRCQYCGARVRRDEITYDHVVPRALGGKTTWENIVTACVACNQKKGGKTPEQAGMTLRCPPVKPKKLPEVFRITLTFKQGMPECWRAFLTSYSYWHGELEE